MWQCIYCYFGGWYKYLFFFTCAVLASTGISCHCLSVMSQYSTEMDKGRISQTMPHNSPGTVVFWCWKPWQNSNGVTPSRGTKCRWGRLNAHAVAESWQLLTQSVNLVCSQVYHTERPPYLFAARLP